jgi:glyoxylase-like metal-dependent hydrolase (beta-lactamase superfamily II)
MQMGVEGGHPILSVRWPLTRARELGRYSAFVWSLSEFDLRPSDINAVVNTHGHYDHV